MKARQISKDHPLLLGSSSPRRKEILSGLGLPIEVRPSDADEDVGLTAADAFLQAVVERKRRSLLALVGPDQARFAALLVADTIVVLDGEILGKPTDTSDALRLLCKLEGRTHTVFTRYAIEACGEVKARTVESRVTMRAADLGTLSRYAETGEGLDKAGAYAVQGLGAFLVRCVEGSYTNVVGLPACEVVEDLQAAELLGAYPF